MRRLAIDDAPNDGHAATALARSRRDDLLAVALDDNQDGAFIVGPASSHDTAVLVVGAIAPSASPAFYSYATELVAPPAPVDLRVSKDAGAPEQDARLDWSSAGAPPFTVFRGFDPATVLTAPDLTVPGVLDTFFVDRAVPGPLTFYLVENR